MKKYFLIPTFLFSLLLLQNAALCAPTADELVHLGNVSSKQVKFKEAIQYYTKAIAINPHLLKAFYNRGYVYIEIRKYKLAIADLKTATEIDHAYAPAYHLLGIAYFFQKKYPLAIAHYNKAIELAPENVKYYISRMSCNFKLGNGDKAWKDVIKIQQLGGTVNPSIINILKGKNYRE